MPRLIHNSIQTPDGTVLVSRSRHDYVTHTDENGKSYMVDGGIDYSRRSANGDEISLSLYDAEPHEVQRWVLRWGTYGKGGDKPLTRKPIAEMGIGHIKSVLKDCSPSIVYRNCMEEELMFRDN